jgi:hypothetical protein
VTYVHFEVRQTVAYTPYFTKKRVFSNLLRKIRSVFPNLFRTIKKRFSSWNKNWIDKLKLRFFFGLEEDAKAWERDGREEKGFTR